MMLASRRLEFRVCVCVCVCVCVRTHTHVHVRQNHWGETVKGFQHHAQDLGAFS